jgi:aerobic carbon-monoxide dehydrogenase large subunit
MKNRFVGAPVERVEDLRLITGKGRFTGDLRPDGSWTAHFLRSPYAHARWSKLDASSAKAMPGVHAVFSFDDLPAYLRDKPFPLLVPNPAIRQPLTFTTLANHEACYAGEPVAVIVADSRDIAEDAAELIFVDYEVLRVANDCRDAAKPDAPPAHLSSKDNVGAVMTFNIGDADKAIAEAPHKLHDSYFQHRGCGHAMEGRAVLAMHDPLNDRLSIWSAAQAPYMVRTVIGAMLRLDDTKLRVVAPDVGGGFGPKGIVYHEEVVVAWLAMALNHSVTWSEDRHEQSTATCQERDEYAEADVAFDDDGRVLAVKVLVIQDTGAYMPFGIITEWVGATTLPGPYVLPNYRMDMTITLTNKVPCSPLRGNGRPQAVFVMERLIDRIAQYLGKDRAAVRELNMIKPEQMPYKVGLTGRDNSPVTYDSGDYPGCQRMAVDQADYSTFEERQQQARKEGRYLGIGIGNVVEATGLGPHEGATVRVLSSGKIGVFTGAAAQGQGHATVLTQVAADAFGTEIDQIEVFAADTALFPNGVGTFASRVAVNAGSSVHNASAKLRDLVLQVAADQMGIPSEEIAILPGKVKVKDEASVRIGEGKPIEIPLSQLLLMSNGVPGYTASGQGNPGLSATDYFRPTQATYSNATHVVELEVDVETGLVQLLRYIVGHDCGRVLNPLIVCGQIQGGVAHGIGNALYEYMDYDEHAQPQTNTLEEYLLPGVLDVPKVEIVQMESPTPLNPLGIKGAGESGTIPAAAAIISAIENALQPFDIKISRCPLQAEHIVEMIARSKVRSQEESLVKA